MSRFLKIDELLESLTQYIRVKAELIKLNMIEGLSDLMAQLISFIFILVVFLFFLVFASITLGAFLNEWLESAFWGYGIVSGFYFLVLLFFIYLLRSGKLKEAIEVEIVKMTEQMEAEVKEKIKQKEDEQP